MAPKVNVFVVAALVCFFTVSLIDAHPRGESIEMKLLKDLLSIPQKTSTKLRFNATNVGMSWKNCGSQSDPIRANVSLMPDPVPVPGKVTAAFDAIFDVNVLPPLKVVLEIKKEVAGIWVPIPCIDNVGSCTYDDICSLIPIPPTEPCPPPFSTYKIPCTCPFPKGTYKLPSSDIEIPEIPNIPEWLTNGEYQATATLSNQGKRLACYTAQLSIKAD
ncbi:ganglioside GM2 activator-like [Saccoglossus kowalevskii]|uniref:Ganglioside GM2 activator-like n=1 Tax=Saccoglossus kowalevskii TaxID=10224 RepID=A0ABM0GP74_SACKO|nr:PREDICTED: ganglioside GM2 activator-like [Saccoglossus kowalevskii]